MRNVYLKALWDQRKAIPAWGSGLALVILLESAMWPSFKDMSSLNDYLDEFPPAMKELFGVEEMMSGRGFLNTELFTLLLPIMFLVYGITRGARMLAGEEEAGTLDLLLVTRLSTTTLLVQEALGLVSGLLALGGVVFVSTVLGSAMFGLEVGVNSALAGSLAVTLIGIEFGVAALVAGALTGRRSMALGIPTGLALAAYVLYVAGLFVDELSSWRGWSPFDQALHEGPLSASVPLSFGLLAVVPLLLCAGALPLWSRRDISASR